MQPNTVTQDAIALWNMDGVTSACGKYALAVQGDVTVGETLKGQGKKDSIARGGDGKIAVFNGGYVTISQNSRHPLRIGGKTMSLCIRLRVPDGQWNFPLLTRANPASSQPGIFQCTTAKCFGVRERGRITNGQALEYVWRTSPLAERVRPEFFEPEGSYRHENRRAQNPDCRDGILRVAAPAELIGLTDWHDVVVRFNGPNLELFVDGVLVDEEWPHGDLADFELPFLLGAAMKDGQPVAGFRGQIDHLALWDRALSDGEIQTLSGGAEWVARRDEHILGGESTSLQYWRPRGYNAYVGDTMPFYHDGTFHFYYLFDRKHHQSKWASGAHQFGHVSSRDLIHWEHHPHAVTITDQTELSLGTGQCVYHDGIYYMYYIQHARRFPFHDAPHIADDVFVTTSRDGIHFGKNPEPWVKLDYQTGGDINPLVFPAEAGGKFFMYNSGGRFFESTDLKTWRKTDAIASMKDINIICANYFKWNDWYYFAGCSQYWMSRTPAESGQWVGPFKGLADGLAVPEIAPFTGNRQLLVGFLTRPSYAGEAVFRELVQHADGTLGMKWPAEMVPASGEPVKTTFAAIGPGAEGDNSRIRIATGETVAAGMLTGVPRNAKISLRVVPQSGTKAFGLCVRGKGEYDAGCELRMEPARQRVQFGVPENRGLAKEATDKVWGGTDFPIADKVEHLDQPFSLEVIVKDDIIDACIGWNRTLVTRIPAEADGDRLFFFAQAGEVVFENIQIRPLVDEHDRTHV